MLPICQPIFTVVEMKQKKNSLSAFVVRPNDAKNDSKTEVKSATKCKIIGWKHFVVWVIRLIANTYSTLFKHFISSNNFQVWLRVCPF